MLLTGLVPVLMCSSVAHSLRFYKDTLQFVEIKTRNDNNELVWAYIKSGNSYLMLEQAHEIVSQQNNSISLYFYTDDVKSFYRYMSAKNYTITEPDKTEFRLLECTFYDPDGHKVQVAELIK